MEQKLQAGSFLQQIHICLNHSLPTVFIRVTLSKMHVPFEIKMPKLQRDVLFERLSTEGKQLPNRFLSVNQSSVTLVFETS